MNDLNGWINPNITAVEVMLLLRFLKKEELYKTVKLDDNLTVYCFLASKGHYILRKNMGCCITFEENSTSKVIFLRRELLTKNKNMFNFVLQHELGHAFFRHNPRLKYKDSDIIKTILHEFEANIYAATKIPRKEILRQLSDSYKRMIKKSLYVFAFAELISYFYVKYNFR